MAGQLHCIRGGSNIGQSNEGDSQRDKGVLGASPQKKSLFVPPRSPLRFSGFIVRPLLVKHPLKAVAKPPQPFERLFKDPGRHKPGPFKDPLKALAKPLQPQAAWVMLARNRSAGTGQAAPCGAAGAVEQLYIYIYIYMQIWFYK